MIVVDASVVIKWFAPEAGWEAARSILDSDDILAAPSHVVVEAGRGLLRHHRNGHLSVEQARRRIAGLTDSVRLVPIETLVDTAFEIASTTSVTIYDALYVALAALEDCVLVTADLRLSNGLRGGPLARHVVALPDWPSRPGN